jgi:hypothetical protein
VLLGYGDGGFGLPVSYGVGVLPFAVSADDFNGDGHLDLAVANAMDGTVSVLLGYGDGGFGTQRPIPTCTSPKMVLSADFNRDGNPDLAVDCDGVAALLYGDGGGGFASPSFVQTEGSNSYGMVSADLTGTGAPDLVVTDLSLTNVCVLLDACQ